jgi:hypothetical protein
LCGGAGPAWARSGGAGPACGGARSSCGSPGFPSLYFCCGGARSSCGDFYPQHKGIGSGCHGWCPPSSSPTLSSSSSPTTVRPHKGFGC